VAVSELLLDAERAHVALSVKLASEDASVAAVSVAALDDVANTDARPEAVVG
jgi:hypothetical protein